MMLIYAHAAHDSKQMMEVALQIQATSYQLPAPTYSSLPTTFFFYFLPPTYCSSAFEKKREKEKRRKNADAKTLFLRQWKMLTQT